MEGKYQNMEQAKEEYSRYNNNRKESNKIWLLTEIEYHI